MTSAQRDAIPSARWVLRLSRNLYREYGMRGMLAIAMVTRARKATFR